jgi:hypothetical protein
MEDFTDQEKTDSNVQFDQESIIDRFLDVINIKRLLKIVFDKTPFRISNSFISGFILLIFLSWLYYADIFSKYIVILVLIIFLVLDLLGKNVGFVRRFLFSEDSNNAFLDNINKYSFDEAGRQTILRKFTPSNINHYLQKIKENPNLKYGFVLENILLYNRLSIENFDILFSEDFLNFNLLRRDFVINLLMNYKDRLSKNDLVNLCNYYKTDEKILRYIFATQIQSEFLVRINTDLMVYSEKFQINKDSEFYKLKRNLPSFPLDLMNLRLNTLKLGIILCLVLFAGNSLIINGYVNPSYSIILLLVFMAVLLFSALIAYTIYHIFYPRLMDKWDKFKTFVEIA